MDGIKQFFKAISGFVARMTPSQVMMLLGVIAGTLVGIVLLAGWLSSVNYARLYTGLEEKEAGDVISYLRDNKIKYRLEDGGRTIEVPADQVYATRIALATEGLPRSAQVGYSIFDQNNLGMTDFLQNLNFRRALEGELTKTITELDEVEAARVHIVMPKERLFKDDQKQATASVVLKLSAGRSLSRQQLAGITHLVASSVEGLEPGNIAILDYSGNLLTPGRQADPTIGLSSSQLELAQQVEQHLQHKAQSMLDEVLGPGKSVVRVTAELNFQQLERTSEKFDPDASQIRSEERVRQSTNDSDRSPDTSQSQHEDNSETIRTNYELNKTVEHVINSVGSIQRLSVAVLVDGTYTPAEGGEGGMTYQPRPTEEMDRLQSIVRNAVGYDSRRDDQVEMVNVAFDRTGLEQDRQALDTMYNRDFYWEVARKVGYVLAAVLLFLYLRRKARKFFSSLGQISPPPTAPPNTENLAPIVSEEAAEIQPQVRRPRLVERMQETARRQPDEMARVIKTMMVD